MKNMKRAAAALILLFSMVILSSCTDSKKESFETPESGKIAVLVGTTSEKIAEETFPDAEILKFDALADAVIALQSGKADYVVTAKSNCINYANHNPDLAVLDDALGSDAASIAINKTETGLNTRICALLSQYEEDGTLKQLEANWMKTDGSAYVMTEIEEVEGPELRIAISAEREPMCYVMNGEYAGMDIELARRLAYDLGMKPVFYDMKFSAMIPSVTTDKTQIAISNISAAPERKESVDFSQKYFDNPQLMLTRKEIAEALNLRENELSFEEQLQNLNGHPMGVASGTVFDALTAQWLPDSERLYFNNNADMIAAIKQGKISGFMADEPMSVMILRENPALEILPGMIEESPYGYIFQKNESGAALRDEFNEYLAKIKEDGTLAAINQAWMSEEADSIQLEDATKFPAKKGTLRLGSDGLTPPFMYYRNEEYVGIDMDILTRFCKEQGYALEIQTMTFDALIPSLVSDRMDVSASCFAITEERKKSVNFSEPTYDGGVVVIKQKADTAQNDGNSFWQTIAGSFEKNFVREQRWKLLVSGMGITLLISLCSLAFGTAAGFGICMLRRTKNRILSGIAKAYIRLLQGTPIVVLLMIFYYIIFNKSGLSGVTVAIIAFGMNYSAYAAEILRSGIDAVDAGQLEAAAAIGFTKTQTFCKIVFPQAAVHFLPVLKGEFISLVKMTSVVGYVAVQDLTKASDIIRSRTYEAFFPLIVIAVLYFLLAWGLSSLLGFLDIRIDPKRRKLKLPELVEEKGGDTL